MQFESQDLFIFGAMPDYFDCFADLETVESPLRPALQAFRANLESAFTIGSVPFRLTHSAVLNQRFQQILAATRIRSLPFLEERERETTEEVKARERVAYAKAQESMAAELEIKDTIERHATETLRVLDSHLRDQDFRFSAEEMLRQLIVLGWGAFEVLVNDLLRLLLNARPGLIKNFAEVKTYRDLIAGRPLLDALDSYAFNLSSAMGDFFSEVLKIDSMEKIRDAVAIALADDAVNAMLKDEKLWRISQQRHLIVHRRGLIDARYIAKTSDKEQVGSHIRFNGPYVEASLKLLRDVGCTLYKAGRQKLVPTEEDEAC